METFSTFIIEIIIDSHNCSKHSPILRKCYQFGILNFGSIVVALVAFLLVVCGLVISKRMLKQVEKELVSVDAKVFVICPYCGAKTEQGIVKCQKCGADL